MWVNQNSMLKSIMRLNMSFVPVQQNNPVTTICPAQVHLPLVGPCLNCFFLFCFRINSFWTECTSIGVYLRESRKQMSIHDPMLVIVFGQGGKNWGSSMTKRFCSLAPCRVQSVCVCFSTRCSREMIFDGRGACMTHVKVFASHQLTAAILINFSRK